MERLRGVRGGGSGSEGEANDEREIVGGGLKKVKIHMRERGYLYYLDVL